MDFTGEDLGLKLGSLHPGFPTILHPFYLMTVKYKTYTQVHAYVATYVASHYVAQLHMLSLYAHTYMSTVQSQGQKHLETQLKNGHLDAQRETEAHP